MPAQSSIVIESENVRGHVLTNRAQPTTRKPTVPLFTLFLDTAQQSLPPSRVVCACTGRNEDCALLSHSNLSPSRVRASPSRVSDGVCAVCCLDGITCRWLGS